MGVENFKMIKTKINIKVMFQFKRIYTEDQISLSPDCFNIDRENSKSFFSKSRDIRQKHTKLPRF